MSRVVFDTNTIISAMLHPQRTPDLALTLGLRHHQIMLSDAVIQELAIVARRSKFDRYLSFEDRLEFVNRLVGNCSIFEPTETIRVCRDPKDDKFLELAVAGNANYLITGDDDLIALNPFRTVQIISPAMFLETSELE